MNERIWGCKIGGMTDADLDGADFPMRQAVRRAFEEVTGRTDEFCFSGWGTTLDKDEREHVDKLRKNQRAKIGDLVEFKDDNDIKWRGIVVGFEAKALDSRGPIRWAYVAILGQTRLATVIPDALTVKMGEFYTRAMSAMSV